MNAVCDGIDRVPKPRPEVGRRLRIKLEQALLSEARSGRLLSKI